jgi:hypothetical protein
MSRKIAFSLLMCGLIAACSQAPDQDRNREGLGEWFAAAFYKANDWDQESCEARGLTSAYCEEHLDDKHFRMAVQLASDLDAAAEDSFYVHVNINPHAYLYGAFGTVQIVTLVPHPITADRIEFWGPSGDLFVLPVPNITSLDPDRLSAAVPGGVDVANCITGYLAETVPSYNDECMARQHAVTRQQGIDLIAWLAAQEQVEIVLGDTRYEVTAPPLPEEIQDFIEIASTQDVSVMDESLLWARIARRFDTPSDQSGEMSLGRGFEVQAEKYAAALEEDNARLAEETLRASE